MIKEARAYDAALGLGVGKRSHWACLASRDGEVLTSSPVWNSEADLDGLFSQAGADVLVVVDQIRDIGALAISRARAASLPVAYLPGLAAHGSPWGAHHLRGPLPAQGPRSLHPRREPRGRARAAKTFRWKLYTSAAWKLGPSGFRFSPKLRILGATVAVCPEAPPIPYGLSMPDRKPNGRRERPWQKVTGSWRWRKGRR